MSYSHPGRGISTAQESDSTAVWEEHQLKRGLENRHLQLIAIGGAIGTGLFLGSGRTISLAGPSIVLVYAVIGFFLYIVMRAMGELLLSNLAYKSFADFATDLVGRWAGFYVGWTYWMCWVVIDVADTTAICGYFAVWAPDVPRWIPALAVLVILVSLNLVAVRLFGEFEFWFAMIKIITIVALIMVGAYLAVTGFQAPVQGAPPASFTHLWDRGGFFPSGLTGFLAGFQIAIFSFQGIEMAGTAAAETSNPRQTLPKAINSIPARVLIFYVGALTVVMAVQPWDMINPDVSPFVEMFGFVGVAIAFHIINFVVLTSAMSSANSGVFSTSRIMFGLARVANAPAQFGRLAGNHIPRRALFLTAICVSPAIILVMLTGSVMDAFSLVAGVSSVLYISVWAIIIVCYLAYLTKHPERHRESIFPLPMPRLACYSTLAFFVAILIVLGTNAEQRLALFAAPLWFVFLIIMWFVVSGARARHQDTDFDAERIKAEAAVNAHEAEWHSQKIANTKHTRAARR